MRKKEERKDINLDNSDEDIDYFLNGNEGGK